MRPITLRHAGLLAIVGYLITSGCGSLPDIPTIDQIRTVPDSSQATVLAPEQFSPKSGPIGTILIINGRGTVFPAGIVNFRFSGTASKEFDLPEATSVIKLFVPQGTVSGPFGFTISGRRDIALENALPTSNIFQAWRFDAPGFIVTTPNGITDGTVAFPNETGGQSQHPLPNSGNQPDISDVH